jgi:hypothetical protein
MPDPDHTRSPDPAQLRRHLDEAHRGLLRVHKALIDHEKLRYERARGRISGPGQFLQLVIHDPWFAWLHQISELVVRIDEMTVPDVLATEQDARATVEQVDRLLIPSETGEPFARRYFEAIQRQPAVVLAHGDVKKQLKQFNG